MCFVATDFQQELNSANDMTTSSKEYKLPTDEIITLSLERFRSPELIFQPMLKNIEEQGIHELVFSSIMRCE